MNRDDDLQTLLLAVHALTRIAALDTQTEAPAAQWRTLTLLRDHGPQRLGDLATLSRVTQPGMTRLVHQMDAAGLVERRRHPDDSRVSVVAATAKGLAALAGWYEQFRAALAPHVADLSEDEWDAVGIAASALSLRVGMAPSPAGRDDLSHDRTADDQIPGDQIPSVQIPDDQTPDDKTPDDDGAAAPTEDRGALVGAAAEEEVVR